MQDQDNEEPVEVARHEKEEGGSFLRGCAIAVGVALLILVFIVGSCFAAL